MATGREHFRLWVQATRIVGIASVPVFWTLPYLAQVATPGVVWVRVTDWVAFMLGWCQAVWLHPDLDLDEYAWSERLLLSYLPPVGLFWAAFWYPYTRSIPHRSRWSHGPIVGTLGRVTYFWLGICGGLLVLGLIGDSLLVVNAWGVGRGFSDYWLVGDTGLSWEQSVRWIVRGGRFVREHWLWGMWVLIGQELATLVTHLIPDWFEFVRPSRTVETGEQL